MVHFLILCVVIAVMISIGGFILNLAFGLIALVFGSIFMAGSAFINLFKKEQK